MTENIKGFIIMQAENAIRDAETELNRNLTGIMKITNVSHFLGIYYGALEILDELDTESMWQLHDKHSGKVDEIERSLDKYYR